MQSVTNQNFGILIAYVLPGFVALWGLSTRINQLQIWLGNSAEQDGTVGGFLYVTLLALTIGLVASTLRWMLLDTLHHNTGIPRPKWSWAKLEKNLQAYILFEENHYRYYQFYGNMLVAVPIGYVSWRSTGADWWQTTDLIFAGLLIVLYFGSRDTLKKYYLRVAELLKSS